MQNAIWKIREISDKVTNVVMNYSEVEAKVREATNDEQWGPHGALMAEIAKETYTYEHFPEVMGMLWKRMLQDNKKNWRRVYKSLLLLSYLILNGSERVVTSAREHLYDLRSLENYTFTDEIGKDQGLNVRQKVKDLVDFIQDDERLRADRKKARKAKDKYVGVSSSVTSRGHGYSDRYDSEPKSSRYDSSFKDFDAQIEKQRKKESRFRSFHDRSDSPGDSPVEYPSEGEYDYTEEEESSTKKEFHEDEEEYTSSSKTKPTVATTTTKTKSRKPIDMGAAATYGGGHKKQDSQTLSIGSDLMESKPQEADFFADFTSASTTAPVGTNNGIDDFNPRGSDQPAKATTQDFNGDFGDFTSFQNSSPAKPALGETDLYGGFQSTGSLGATLQSEMSLLSPHPANSNQQLLQSQMSTNPLQSNFMQPIQPQNPLMQAAPLQSQPLQPQVNLMQTQVGSMQPQVSPMQPQANPLQPSLMSSQPILQPDTEAPSIVNSILDGGTVLTTITAQSPLMSASPVHMMSSQQMGNNLMKSDSTASSQNVNMMQQQQGLGNMMPMNAASVNSGSMQMTQQKSSVVKPNSATTPQKNTWSDSKVNISLDSLSPADKYKKVSQPSMNQLVGSQTQVLGSPQQQQQQQQQQHITNNMAQMNLGNQMPQQGMIGMQQQGMMGAMPGMVPMGMGMQQGNMGMQQRNMGMQQGSMGMMQGNMGMQQTNMGMGNMGMNMGMGMGQRQQMGNFGTMGN
ncbi:clathrin interactor 1-like isoform X8 [Anneissia japonica]|uniref:clathrin interactor 1-like isoform X8 n=1 Tax=Anneissia japonica TaxID=1529436 RepID=UPI001425AB07|nr:clathrin interactor 1-like isoform X8 [Anneissia japonica]